MEESTYCIQNLLDYHETANMKKDLTFRHKIIKTEFRKLIKRILDENIKPETTDVDVAYRIQFKVIDDMNVVGKITSIPVLNVVLKNPIMNQPEYTYQANKKYTIKERLKILFKGAI